MNNAIALPVPSANGVGAAVSAAGLAPEKTIILAGTLIGAVTIEISADGGTTFAPLCIFGAPGKQFQVAPCTHMRARVQNYTSGSATCDVGAAVGQVMAAAIALPAGNGVGASTDISEFGYDLAFILSGTVGGGITVTIEGSQDNSDWAPITSFGATGVKYASAALGYVRARVNGFNTGDPYTATLAVAGAPLSAGGIADNVVVTELVPAQDTVIYVRTAGSDVTGAGTLANPYATIRHAINQIPYVISGRRYIIDAIGVTETITTPLRPGGRTGPNQLSATALASGALAAQIHIRGDITSTLTLQAGDITSISVDAVTGLRTINTNLNLVANALKGMIIQNSSLASGYAVVVSNTVGPNSSIETTMASSPAAPFVIGNPSCTISNTSGSTDANTGPCVNVCGTNVGVSFEAITFQTANASQPGLVWSDTRNAARAFGCKVAFPWSQFGTQNPRLNGCYVTNTVQWSDLPLQFSNCFLDSINWATAQGINFVGPSTSCVIEAAVDAFGPTSTLSDQATAFNYAWTNSLFRNGLGGGIDARFARMFLQNLTISGCAGDAISARLSQVTLNNITGTGNGGIGVRLEDGSHVRRLAANVTVTGAGGDYQVGGNAAAPAGGVGWAALAGGSENDIAAAAASQFCRLS